MTPLAPLPLASSTASLPSLALQHVSQLASFLSGVVTALAKHLGQDRLLLFLGIREIVDITGHPFGWMDGWIDGGGRERGREG